MEQQGFDPNSFRLQGADAINSALDTYSSGGGAEFFALKDDGDSSRVVFLHGDSNDLDTFTVHKVAIGDKERYVACLSPQNMPCPLCSSGLKPTVRTFISLFDLTDGKKKLWDRGKNEIQTLLARIAKFGPLNTRVYEITRKGKKGDTGTTYDILPDGDPLDVRQIVAGGDISRQEIIGPDKFVLVKSPQEMEQIAQQSRTPSYGYTQQPPQSSYNGYNPNGGYNQGSGYNQYQQQPQNQYQQNSQPGGGSVQIGRGDQHPNEYARHEAPPAGSGSSYFTPNGPRPVPDNANAPKYNLD